MSSKLGALGAAYLLSRKQESPRTTYTDDIRGGCPFTPPPQQGGGESSTQQQGQMADDATAQQSGFLPAFVRIP